MIHHPFLVKIFSEVEKSWSPLVPHTFFFTNVLASYSVKSFNVDRQDNYFFVHRQIDKILEIHLKNLRMSGGQIECQIIDL